MKDDINLFDYNVQERVNDFVAAAIVQVCQTFALAFPAMFFYFEQIFFLH